MHLVSCRSEHDRSDQLLLELCRSRSGILISNYLLASGGRPVEIDGILISRNFVCTIEVKYTRHVGRLQVNLNRNWTVDGADAGLENPSHQARRQAQAVGPFLKRRCSAVGHVTSTVLVGGNLTMDAVYRSAVHVAVVGNFHDCLARVAKTTRPLCVQDVNTMIQSLDLDPVPESVLLAEGFDVVSSERLEDYLWLLEVLSGREPRQLAALRGAAGILLRLAWEDLEEQSSDIAELRHRIRSGFPSMREVAVQQLANLASYLFEIRVFDDGSWVELDERWANRFASLIAEEVPNA